MSDYYSTGRGGAGNMAHGQKSPKVQEVVDKPGDEIPHLTQETFTTGRGGAGNMLKNIDKDNTRLAQDVEEDQDLRAAPMKSNRSIGRGGFGNLHAVSSRDQQTNGQGSSSSSSSILSKVKNIFK